MELLIHVSFAPIEKFVLRIPKDRAKGEDRHTKRICLSDNMKCAIQAMPDGGKALRGMLKIRGLITPMLHVYFCEIPENAEAFIPPDVVQSKYHVVDAINNHEWWALEVPKFEHRLIEVKKATFRDGVDRYGNPGVAIDDLDEDLLKGLPTNAPEIIFSKKEFEKYDIRVLFKTIDDIQIRNNKAAIL